MHRRYCSIALSHRNAMLFHGNHNRCNRHVNSTKDALGCCHIEISLYNLLKLKSPIMFTCYIFFSFQITLKFCMEHRKDTNVLCANFQNLWAINMDVTTRETWVLNEFGRDIQYSNNPQAGSGEFIFGIICHNTVNPVHGVATVCHQVHCMCWDI